MSFFSRSCGTGDALRAVLADLAAEGLLQSLLPMLLVPKSDANDAGCHLQMHHRDRAQRPASRGPEAPRPPAETASRTALATDHSLQRQIHFHEDQGASHYDPAMRG